MANTLCAKQTAKNWRKSPEGFFDTRKRPFWGVFYFFLTLNRGMNRVERVVESRAVFAMR